ncbi:MAG: hypothetical protein AB3A66_04505 [Nodularia sp. CChRGM 3473]
MPTARYAVSAAMPVRALRQFLFGETTKTGLPHQRAVSPLRLKSIFNLPTNQPSVISLNKTSSQEINTNTWCFATIAILL